MERVKFMYQVDENSATRRERLRSALMMFCALILFAMGVLLLIAPRRAQAAEVGDNVNANNCHLWS
jgi:hypothetical protein